MFKNLFWRTDTSKHFMQCRLLLLSLFTQMQSRLETPFQRSLLWLDDAGWEIRGKKHLRNESLKTAQAGIYGNKSSPRLMSVNYRKSLFKAAGRKVRLQQNRVGQRTALFPGPEPSTCPEIRIACCPKSSSVRKGWM